jgi:hypothetical protein
MDYFNPDYYANLMQIKKAFKAKTLKAIILL